MKKFEQLKRLYGSVTGYMKKDDYSNEAVSALTSDFDRLFELSWKTLKEYMFKDLGIYEARTGSPREIIKLAYQQELLDDAEVFLDILADRNDDTHRYKYSEAVLYASRIQGRYMEMIRGLIQDLSALIPEEEMEEIKLPLSLIREAGRSGLYLDEYVRKIKEAEGYASNDEVFLHWEDLEGKYLNE